MYKLSMIIGSGMVSVFNATWVLQWQLAGKTQPVVFSNVSPETVMEFFREFGLPTGFAIVFGLVCVAGAIRWYRDLQSMIEQRDAELLKRDIDIKKLTDENKQLTRDHAEYKAKYDMIINQTGGNDENAK